jgi:hypothetical protein
MTTDELLEVVRAYAQERYPRTPAVRVRIDLADGEPIRLPIPDRAGVTRMADVDAPRVSRIERKILRAVADMDTEEPTGPEIAAAAKLPYEPEFRKTLSAMRKRDLLGGGARDQGYPIAAAGLAAIQADV